MRAKIAISEQRFTLWLLSYQLRGSHIRKKLRKYDSNTKKLGSFIRTQPYGYLNRFKMLHVVKIAMTCSTLASI